jgi:hypothetical protein
MLWRKAALVPPCTRFLVQGRRQTPTITEGGCHSQAAQQVLPYVALRCGHMSCLLVGRVSPQLLSMYNLRQDGLTSRRRARRKLALAATLDIGHTCHSTGVRTR